MSIPMPNLDDRNFDDLVAEARSQINAVDPDWGPDFSDSDPGMVLVDAFAHLTDILLYRLNRVPERAYAAFLNLLGTQLRPPCAATVVLQLTRANATAPLTIPAGLNVTVAQGDSNAAPVFFTTDDIQFPAGGTQVNAAAVNADTHNDVVLGTGTGLPGQSVRLPNSPAVAEITVADLRVAVELDPGQTPSDGGAVIDGKPFQFWQEVTTFADATPADALFILDRVTGRVSFAPVKNTGAGPGGPVAAVPGNGRQIRGWWTNSGAQGNVDADSGVVLGTGTGLPGQSVTVPGTPVAQATVRVAVEMDPGQTQSGSGQVIDGKPFQFWQEVATFADAQPWAAVFLLDRVTGIITFAPAVSTGAGPAAPVAAVPGNGREIRAWWSSGGGAQGNVKAGTLTVLKGAPSGVTVTNPAAAMGGRDTESVADAMVRAPIDFHTRQRAVTASDYEVLAVKASGAVQQARAYNRSSIWCFAQPGEVEIVVEAAAGAISADEGTEAIRTAVLQYLQDRAPLGVSCIVGWVKYKTVAVHARVIIRPEEDPAEVKRRMAKKLDQTIAGIPIAGPPGLQASAGARLHQSSIVTAMQQGEPGILYVDQVRFVVDDVPDADVQSLMPDGYQPNTWYAGAGSTFFRTLDRGDGWESSSVFTDETVWTIAPYPAQSPSRPQALSRQGWVAIGTRYGTDDNPRSRIYLSRDLGEHWDRVADVGWNIDGLAWVERGGPRLLFVGTGGVYDAPAQANAPLGRVSIDPTQDEGLSFYAINSFLDYRGAVGVVVAAQGNRGVWLSDQAGASGTFFPIRRSGDDIRAVAIQYDGAATYIWSARSISHPADTGCLRLRLDDLTQVDRSGILTEWETLDTGWTGGSCWSVSFGGQQAYAATESGGVLRLDLTAAQPEWQAFGIDCGLPHKPQPPSLIPVQSVAATGDGQIVLAAGNAGVYRSDDAGVTYHLVSQREAPEFVSLSPTWLFRPGEHHIDVLVADPGAEYAS